MRDGNVIVRIGLVTSLVDWGHRQKMRIISPSPPQKNKSAYEATLRVPSVVKTVHEAQRESTPGSRTMCLYHWYAIA